MTREIVLFGLEMPQSFYAKRQFSKFLHIGGNVRWSSQVFVDSSSLVFDRICSNEYFDVNERRVSEQADREEVNIQPTHFDEFKYKPELMEK